MNIPTQSEPLEQQSGLSLLGKGKNAYIIVAAAAVALAGGAVVYSWLQANQATSVYCSYSGTPCGGIAHSNDCRLANTGTGTMTCYYINSNCTRTCP